MANETGCTYDNGNGNKLSARAAAFEVLKKARKPLHCSEITRRVLKGRLAPGNALLGPVDPAMMQLSKVELVKYSETGEA